MRQFLDWLRKYADSTWYAVLVAVGAGLDAFFFIVPIEAMLLPSIVLRPRRWWSSALIVATGSAIGAAVLAQVVSVRGPEYLAHLFPDAHHSENWICSEELMRAHGTVALAGIAVSPIPQQPAVAFAGLVHIPAVTVFFAVWTGRAIKYLFVCAIASFAPSFLRKKKTI